MDSNESNGSHFCNSCIIVTEEKHHSDRNAIKCEACLSV